MTLTSEQKSVVQALLRLVPSRNRLTVLNDVLVSEVEHLGYELANELNSEVATAVFIAAHEVESRLGGIQNLIEAH